MWWPSMFASSFSSSSPPREFPLACGYPFKSYLLFAHPFSVYHDMILVNYQGRTLTSSSSAPHPGIATQIKGWAVFHVDFRGRHKRPWSFWRKVKVLQSGPFEGPFGLVSDNTSQGSEIMHLLDSNLVVLSVKCGLLPVGLSCDMSGNGIIVKVSEPWLT
jgi:hypothetical protein